MKKISSNILLLLSISLLSACLDVTIVPDDPTPTEDPYRWLQSMEFLQAADSITLIEGGAGFQLGVRGTFVEDIIETATVTGVLSANSENRKRTVTTSRSIPNLDISWTSTNAGIATVIRGEVSPVAGGSAQISGRIGSVTIFPAKVFIVIPLPVITLNGSATETVYFLDSGLVSGTVDVNTDLFINNEPWTYDENGYFERYFADLTEGENTVTVKAVNKEYPLAFSTAQKVFDYQPRPIVVDIWNGVVNDSGSYFNMTLQPSDSVAGGLDISGVYNYRFSILSFPGNTLTGIVYPDSSFTATFSVISGIASGDGYLTGTFSTESSFAGNVRHEIFYNGNTIIQNFSFTGSKQ